VNPVAEELQRTIVRLGRASRLREVKALAETAARVLVLDGLAPEPDDPASPDDDERILTPAERAKRHREKKARERHAARNGAVTKSDEPSRNVTRKSDEKVTPRDGFRDGPSRAKSEDSLFFSEETAREETREEKSESQTRASVTRNVTPLRDALRVTENAKESVTRLIASSTIFPLPESFTLTPERRAYAELVPLTDVDAVFKKFGQKAIQLRWLFDAAGWESRWKQFCDDEARIQRKNREHERANPASGPSVVAAPAEGSIWAERMPAGRQER
jgi:hypothetical protein